MSGSAGASRYASVVLDVDSTLCGIEGIDWLAALRSPDLAAEIAALTRRAMAGEFPLEEVYGERLRRIAPTADEIAGLAAAYRERIAPGAGDALDRLRTAGVSVLVVSGGLRPAILPTARALGFEAATVHAVDLAFDSAGAYAGYDRSSPLARQGGKVVVVEALDLPRPILAVGDGVTDLELRPVVDSFAAYTGFVRRDPVAKAADCELPSFDALVSLVLP